MRPRSPSSTNSSPGSSASGGEAVGKRMSAGHASARRRDCGCGEGLQAQQPRRRRRADVFRPAPPEHRRPGAHDLLRADVARTPTRPSWQSDGWCCGSTRTCRSKALADDGRRDARSDDARAADGGDDRRFRQRWRPSWPAIGLYGVLAFTVAQRTSEIGLRMALGATRRGVRWMVLRQVGAIVMVGGTLGLASAMLVGRAAQALLFGLQFHDPVVLASSIVVLMLVALAAGFVPAYRAARVDPMRALKYRIARSLSAGALRGSRFAARGSASELDCWQSWQFWHFWQCKKSLIRAGAPPMDRAVMPGVPAGRLRAGPRPSATQSLRQWLPDRSASSQTASTPPIAMPPTPPAIPARCRPTTSRAPPLSTSATTRGPCAPRAIRIPISFVRCATL